MSRPALRQAGLVFLLAAGAVLVVATNRHPVSSSVPFFPCGTANAIGLSVSGPRSTVDLERAQPSADWTIPGEGRPVDQSRVTEFLNHLSLILASPAPGGDSSPGATRLSVECRVVGGASYTLSVGSPSPSSAGYFARKSGVAQLVVIPSVSVDAVDRFLASPPVT